MKRLFAMLFVLLLAVLMSACAGEQPAPRTVSVCLEESELFTVLNNGQQLVRGSNARFGLELKEGWKVVGLDYPGTSDIYEVDGETWLELYDVRYPTRVCLQVTNTVCTISYYANGGTQTQPVRKSYDLSNHPRPNTDHGRLMFSRPGYTLVGWNTEADGTGTAVGLGSRITVSGPEQTLYAQWAQWTDESLFETEAEGDSCTITGYSGQADHLVIPEYIDGRAVRSIASGAFQDGAFLSAVIPATVEIIDGGAFAGCAVRELTLFDSLKDFGDSSFSDCPSLHTLHVNAATPPYGYHYRRESVYADKLDLLIAAAGQKKLVFYSGCSLWYNLDSYLVRQAMEEQGGDYLPLNLALNGVVSSEAQLQIMSCFLEEGDILFHTPELSSITQMMLQEGMGKHDAKLWCGLEYNYDLASLVDVQSVPGFLSSFAAWLEKKTGEGSYQEVYSDKEGNRYLDSMGSASFPRYEHWEKLGDETLLDPDYISAEGMEKLKGYYDKLEEKGVRIYLSYAALNLEAVPVEQQSNVAFMDGLFRSAIESMEGPVLISRLDDYVFHYEDFFDTNYHLLTPGAARVTGLWMRDLKAQMQRDGLWDGEA